MRPGGDLVLTIDAGGSGVKATVFSAAAGRLVACVRRGYRASFPAPVTPSGTRRPGGA